MTVSVIKIFPPGTRVMLHDPGYAPWAGRVVVCLCKRHVWQPALGGVECGHVRCGFRRSAGDCPWPMHVMWDNGNESHQGEGLVLEDSPLTRPVPEQSGEAAIYSLAYLTRREGTRYGARPEEWRLHT